MKKYNLLFLLPFLLFYCTPDKKVETLQEAELPGNKVVLTSGQLKNTNIETGILGKKIFRRY